MLTPDQIKAIHGKMLEIGKEFELDELAFVVRKGDNITLGGTVDKNDIPTVIVRNVRLLIHSMCGHVGWKWLSKN